MCRIAALLAALMLTAASPVAGRGAMSASLEGSIVGFSIDPTAVAGRCPPAFPQTPPEWAQAILRSAGSGTLASAAYTGPVTFTAEHCTVIVVVTEHAQAVVRIRAGLMTITTPGGDTLSLAYEAPGVFRGDLFLVGPREHVGNGPYTITGGTGVFAGATGHGHMNVQDQGGPTAPLTLNGSLG
jgi:hypothetical protein